MTSYNPNQSPYNNPNNPGGGPGYQPPQAYPGVYVPVVMNPYATEKNGLGGWALGLGIASVVCCGIFTGIPAIILGCLGIQAANQGRATNRGASTAGIILGVISIVWNIIALYTGLLDSLLNL